MSEQENSETELEQPAVELEEVEQSDTATGEQVEAQPEQEQEPDYQKIIAEKAFEARQAKREKEELAKRLADIEAQKPTEQRPNVPAMPDPYDDDFETKVRARDEQLLKQAQFDAQQSLLQQQAQQAQLAEQQKAQQELANRAGEYAKRATALGVDSQELQQAAQRIQGFVNDDVAGYILDSDKGPLITKYLASNPLELDKLSTMSPMQAGEYMASVKAKAAEFGQKKVTSAPEPVETIQGGGVASEHPALKGATWK